MSSNKKTGSEIDLRALARNEEEGEELSLSPVTTFGSNQGRSFPHQEHVDSTNMTLPNVATRLQLSGQSVVSKHQERASISTFTMSFSDCDSHRGCASTTVFWRRT